MADLKTLEHFVSALQAFDASQSKTMVEKRRYKSATVSLSALLALVLMLVGAREARRLLGDDDKTAKADKASDETTALDWPAIEERINQRLGETPVAGSSPDEDLSTTQATSTTARSELELSDVLIRLAHLQIEQNNYLAEILAGNAKRRPPPKPPTLLSAERVATSRSP